jgi:hypothetical protein
MSAAVLFTFVSAYLAPPTRVARTFECARRSRAFMMDRLPLPAGSLVALATPMQESGEVDIPTLRTLLQWHKEQGTDGVVILGTTGEASSLTDDEKAEVMAVTREEVGGAMPIIVGTGTISTPATIAATKKAKLFGADAALVVTPYYVKPSQVGLVSHFTQIADAADLPIVLYNVPGRTGVDLSIESTVTLSRHPMIQGLKDATGDNTRVAPMRSIIGDDFRLYSGDPRGPWKMSSRPRWHAAPARRAQSGLGPLQRTPRRLARRPRPREAQHGQAVIAPRRFAPQARTAWRASTCCRRAPPAATPTPHGHATPGPAPTRGTALGGRAATASSR